MYLTLAEIQAFINFVNGNIGKKIFTDANPSAVIAGKKLLTNGVGLGVDMVDDISYQLGIVGDWDITTQPVVPVDLKIGQRYFVTTEGTYNGVFADVGDIVEFTSLTSIFVYPVATTLIRLSDLTNYATKTYAESLVLGLLDDRGSYDPTITSAYPTIENFGSGVDGAILKGDIWFFSSDGVCGVGNNVLTGYSVRALVDDPGQIDSNWNILSVGLGYVSENVDNKKTSVNGALSSPNDTDYPSTLVVDDALNLKADILDQTHTGAMRLPSSLKIYDVISTTKEVAVNVSGLTAGTPRTVTFPDRDIALGDIPIFQATTNYKQYSVIQQNGTIYSAKVDFTSGASFSAGDWTALGSSMIKESFSGNLTLQIGHEYYNVSPPNTPITLELPDPTLIPDGSVIIIHNLAFNTTTTLGRSAWPLPAPSVFLQAPEYTGFTSSVIPAYSKGVITTLSSISVTGWLVEKQNSNVIALSSTPGAGKTYFTREDDVSATLSYNLGAIPTSTNHVITMPNADVNLGTMSSVATTDDNTLSGTRTRIVGGSGNNVSGTDNIIIGSTECKVSSTECAIINSKKITLTGTTQKGVTVSGVGLSNARSFEFPSGTQVIGCSDTHNMHLKTISAFRLAKPTSGTAVVQDSNGVKPYAAFDKYYSSYINYGLHRVTVMGTLNPNNYSIWTVLVRRDYDVTVTRIESGAGNLGLTATQSGDRLNLVVGTTYSANETITVFVESYYTDYK